VAIDFETLAARAEKRVAKRGGKREFVMRIKDDKDIVIPKPDAIVSMQAESAKTLWDQLRVLSGKDFGRILELVKGKDIQVVQDLITEMWEAWDDDSHEVDGGKEA
jgi:hypothetical protein